MDNLRQMLCGSPDECQKYLSSAESIELFPCIPDIIPLKLAANILKVSEPTLIKIIKKEGLPDTLAKADLIRFFEKKLMCYLPVLQEGAAQIALNKPEKKCRFLL